MTTNNTNIYNTNNNTSNNTSNNTKDKGAPAKKEPEQYFEDEELNNKFMTIKENYPKESFKANLNLIILLHH